MRFGLRRHGVVGELDLVAVRIDRVDELAGVVVQFNEADSGCPEMPRGRAHHARSLLRRSRPLRHAALFRSLGLLEPQKAVAQAVSRLRVLQGIVLEGVTVDIVQDALLELGVAFRHKCFSLIRANVPGETWAAHRTALVLW